MLKNNRGIGYISSPIFPETVAHGFLTRVGGVSAPPFDSLNFDLRDADPSTNIDENRKRASSALDAALEDLVTVNQVHGDGIHIVTDRTRLRDRPDADAVITKLTEAPVGVLTADCLPVLLFDGANGAVGAVHAGWKGTAKGIVIKTIDAMGRAYGTKARDILCALGPYIGPCCYTVGEDVEAAIRSSFGDTEGFMERSGNGYRLDIGLLNMRQLISADVLKQNIDFEPSCTSCNNRLFFSYRKDGGRTGRQLSFIMLRARMEG
ncbi:MAG: peptidoglycan editing factor PgeF [Deltaproteobacteria bacterium]|nr:peptidoglycan editing factor PgeF [Deltaproteobacteria bacterium]